jgi:hypothetical protein
VHQTTVRLTALIGQNISNHLDELGTATWGAASVSDFSSSRSVARSLNFDHLRLLRPRPL